MLKAIGNFLRGLRLPKHEIKEIEWEVLIAKALGKIGLPAKYECRIYDGTRIDLLTEHHAAEIDWAPKWAEAIGQSLYYALRARRKPVIILLISKPTDECYVERCRTVCTALRPQIEIWLVNTTTGVMNIGDGYKIQVR